MKLWVDSEHIFWRSECAGMADPVFTKWIEIIDIRYFLGAEAAENLSSVGDED